MQSLLAFCSHGPRSPRCQGPKDRFGPMLARNHKATAATEKENFQPCLSLGLCLVQACWLEPRARLPTWFGSARQARCQTNRLVPSKSRGLCQALVLRNQTRRVSLVASAVLNTSSVHLCLPGYSSCRRGNAVLRPALALPCGRPDSLVQLCRQAQGLTGSNSRLCDTADLRRHRQWQP